MKLSEILKTLGLPLLLTAVFSALLLLFDISLETVENVFLSMLGLQALIGVLIDFGKYIGLVKADTSGVWNARLNLAGLVIVASISGLYPTFDFLSLDEDLFTFANFAFLALGLIVQATGSKSVHLFVKDTLGIAPVAEPSIHSH